MTEDDQDPVETIRDRWAVMPPLRLAKGLEDAIKDWPLGSFGDHPAHDYEVWLTTRNVHASEMVLDTCDIAEVLSHAPDDVRQLLLRIDGLTIQLAEEQRMQRQQMEELRREHQRHIRDYSGHDE